MIPPILRDVPIHLTGVKGTGMAALAEILHDEGARLSGSDVAERFFTDTLLERIGLTPYVGFDADHLSPDVALLVYSSAYGEDNQERAEARRRSIPQYSYTEMLGALSRARRSLAVSGVHGKTTTTAMIGTIVASTALPATVVVGSSVPTFGGSATLRRGRELLVAETCEYRRHFLDFSPHVLIVTSVEADHLDYYRDYEDVLDAFVAFGLSLPSGAPLIYCADDAGAGEVARRLATRRKDLVLHPYGFSVPGVGRVSEPIIQDGRQRFSVALPSGSAEWTVEVPGRHMVLDAAAAILGLVGLVGEPTVSERTTWQKALASFAGTRRRSETVAMVNGIRVMDDYAHHPTAIRTTLAGFRTFWPGRRIVVDFMSHTYSRTTALLDEFAHAFSEADVVFLNEIYASAREQNTAGVSGRELADAVSRYHEDVRFVPDFAAAAAAISDELREGDIFVTMGAGDNFRIGPMVVERLQQTSGDRA
ncbi:MAG: UDP-N-acetylmuramate--L-alanine ligase [Alkalispirochaeta sp.]